MEKLAATSVIIDDMENEEQAKGLGKYYSMQKEGIGGAQEENKTTDSNGNLTVTNGSRNAIKES